jgi:heme exporter protein CcmD
LTAYAAAIAIVAGLILWIVLDRLFLTRAIRRLEARGMTRRSERASGE